SCHVIWIGLVGKMNFELRDRPHVILPSCSLQKVEMSIDQTFFSRRFGAEHSGHDNGYITDRKFVASRQLPSCGNRSAHERSIVLSGKTIPTSAFQFQLAKFPQLIVRHSLEDYGIQTSSAIICEHLDWNDILHARLFRNCAA